MSNFPPPSCVLCTTWRPACYLMETTFTPSCKHSRTHPRSPCNMMCPHSVVTIRSRLLLWPSLEPAVKGFGWIIYTLIPNGTEGCVLWSYRIWNPTPDIREAPYFVRVRRGIFCPHCFWVVCTPNWIWLSCRSLSLHRSLIELEVYHAFTWFRTLFDLGLQNNKTEGSNYLRSIALCLQISVLVKFYSHQLMHFFIQLCTSLLSYIKIT